MMLLAALLLLPLSTALFSRRHGGSVEMGDRPMGMCLDVASCSFENREKARFCARCGIPLRGAFLLGRYEIHELVSKDRGTVTLHAVDRHSGLLVTVRALIPESANDKDREEFLQDAELAKSLS